MEDFTYLLQMIDELLNTDYKIITYENYLDIIILNLKEIYFTTFNKIILESVIDNVINYYFNYIVPPRSYSGMRHRLNTSYVDKKHITYLKNMPQPSQRTKEWYISRYNMITASNAWKALEEGKMLNSFIYSKCLPLNIEKYSNVNMGSPMYWGQLFEDVSIELYEWKYNTKVDDFGCIKDNNYSFLGASPDGINVDDTSPLFGRMLEIKNIVNREITGEPKKEYWVQMQMQMNICQLNECDFLETKFIEYNTYEEFLEDGDFNYTKDSKMKGVIMIFLDKGKPVHEYLPILSTLEEYKEWELKKMTQHKDKIWLKNMYWKLDKYSCVLVLRNKQWYNQALSVFKKIWTIIEQERIEGYEHRAPTRKKCKVNNKLFNGCMLTQQGLKVIKKQSIFNIETELL
tara:strand:+ start:2898 stop:4103 length:1206 start_codon:yes stop_codon:yes gene_type:complete